MPDKIAPGIYFGLPENIYHADPALGSGDVKTLLASPPDYWWQSDMNPLREPDKETFAKAFGRALHHRILYGEAAFVRDYQYISEDGESVSADGLSDWIKAKGGTPKRLKADNEAMIRNEFKVNLLTEKIYNKIMVASSMILKNPSLGQAFVNGWPEVSIFWEQDGVPCKCRIDYLKIKSIVDLKSFRPKDKTKPLHRTLLNAIFNNRYDMQVAHYQNGRAAARELFNAGKVFVYPGAVGPSEEWLAKAMETEQVPWVFVFYKADGMPVSQAVQFEYMGDPHRRALSDVEMAYQNYRDYMEKFGTDIWINTQEPFQVEADDVPAWVQ